MMRFALAILLLAGAVGCGGTPPMMTGPISEEEKQKIREQDKRVDDEERGGSGTATPSKKRR